MSASGIEPFDSDGAGDLFYEVRQAGRGEALEVLRSACMTVLEVPVGGYLEKDYAEAAVAAAAILVARINDDMQTLENNGLSDLIPEIEPDVVREAIRALRRVVEPDSELYELWVDAGGGDQWRSIVDELILSLESRS